jgi:hypothetical protein
LLSNLPVVRSRDARALLLASAAITVAILLWADHLELRGAFARLTPIFFTLFGYFDYHGADGLLLVLLAAIFVPSRVPFRHLLRTVGEHPVRVALLSTGVLAAGTLIVYLDHPLAMDEYAQVFQSRVFAAGHLTGRFPPALLDWLIPKGFQDYFLDVSPTTGQVASAYWPSFALLLTPFSWLGIPWACNPVISGLTLVTVHRLALRIFDDVESAGLVVLLTAASPVFFGEGISYYSMPAHLLANALYALLLVRPTAARALAAGVVGSIALTLHNPVPHLLFAVPWFIWIARRAGGIQMLACLCVGYLPLCLLLGVGWFLFLAHLSHEGAHVASATAQEESLKHALSVFALPSATILWARLIGLAKVWVWAVPGILVLAVVGAWKWRRHSICRLLAASAVLTFVGYLFVPVDQGHGWGYRYFHSAWLALPILAAGALTHVAGGEAAHPFEGDDTRTFVVACALLTLLGGVGLRAFQIRHFISNDLKQVPAYAGTERRVVIIDTRFSFYGDDLVQNDPFLRGPVIRMVSHGSSADASMMQRHFPTMHRVFADRHGTVWSAGPRGLTR